MCTFVLKHEQDTNEFGAGANHHVRAHTLLGGDFLSELVELCELVRHRVVIVGTRRALHQRTVQPVDFLVKRSRFGGSPLQVDQSGSFRRGLIIGLVKYATLVKGVIIMGS